MAKKERQKRSARKARAAERAELEAKQASTAEAGSSEPKAKEVAAAAPKKAEKAKGEKSAKKGGIFAKIGKYFRDVKSELHRVVWPSKRELRNYSVAAIAILIVFGVFFWLVDTGFIALLVGFTGLRG